MDDNEEREPDSDGTAGRPGRYVVAALLLIAVALVAVNYVLLR